MADLGTDKFNDMRVRWLSNGIIKLAVTTDRGPRAVFFGWQDGENIFAELMDITAATDDGVLNFIGGHRLWYAPEVKLRTYWPDSDPLTVQETDSGTLFTTPTDGAGIEKSISFKLAADAPEVTVIHTVRNLSRWDVELAPWAITMCRLGGVGIFPQPTEKADPAGLLPNGRYSFWPYTDPADPRLSLGREVTIVRAAAAPANKIGYRNTDGWIGYLLDGTLFSKHFDPQLGGTHPDYGCNAETFFNERFIEMETLAPLVTLAPGASATHQEIWRLQETPAQITDTASAWVLVQSLGF